MSDLTLPPVPAKSRREHVAQVLREAITSGHFPPGHRLVEVELARQLGTSRAPLREALQQLEHEGLVRSVPYRGSEVLGVSQEEVEQVLVPIRVTLERFAFSKALPRLTDEDMAELERLVGVMDVAARSGSVEALADADIEFHELIIRRSEQTHCLHLWNTIQPRVRAYFRRDAPAHDDPLTVPAQHRRLLEALGTRSESEVQAAIEQHIHIHLGPDQDGSAGTKASTDAQ